MLHAASEDRPHDLRIMRPTRCQLRYRRLGNIEQSLSFCTNASALLVGLGLGGCLLARRVEASDS